MDEIPADVQACARLVEAVDRWNAYAAPTMGEETASDELLDAAVDDSLPTPLGESVAGLEVALRAAARKQLYPDAAARSLPALAGPWPAA